MVNAVEAFDAKHLKSAEEIPAFRPGDTVDVNVKIQLLVLPSVVTTALLSKFI